MRARVWTFITYPDSLPESWQDIVQGETDPKADIGLVPLIVSPIHDKDLAEEGKGYNGTPYKKPHYHNMIIFSQVKSYQQVAAMVKVLGAQHVSQVHSTQSMIRYFIHADHKNKAQYKKEDIRQFNGADVEATFEHNDKEVNGLLKQMIKTIDDHGIIEYHTAVKLFMHDDYFDKYFALATNKYQFFIVNYIKSTRHSTEKT